jgi:hypothetical protein
MVTYLILGRLPERERPKSSGVPSADELDAEPGAPS